MTPAASRKRSSTNSGWLGTWWAAPQLLFIGDFDTGDLEQWADAIDADGEIDPELVPDPVRSPGSGYACSCRVASPYIRTELDGSDRGGVLIQREDIDYYGWSIMNRSPFPVGQWQIAGQWHANTNNGAAWDDASPPVSVTIASTLSGLDPTGLVPGRRPVRCRRRLPEVVL